MPTTLFTQSTIACIWDFDKTLIPEYMQSPLFRRYGIEESVFWEETNKLAEHYRKRGYHSRAGDRVPESPADVRPGRSAARAEQQASSTTAAQTSASIRACRSFSIW
jgi:hypothetical protein